MKELELARASLSAMADPHGVPALQEVLLRLENDLTGAQTEVQVAARASDSLLEFQSALVNLRRSLEPIRDACLAYEDEIDALYWSRGTSSTAAQIVLAVIRTCKHLLDDLVFHFPHRRHGPPLEGFPDPPIGLTPDGPVMLAQEIARVSAKWAGLRDAPGYRTCTGCSRVSSACSRSGRRPCES